MTPDFVAQLIFWAVAGGTLLFSVGLMLNGFVLLPRQMERAYREAYLALALAVEAKEKAAIGHCERVAGRVRELARLAGLPRSRAIMLEHAALLHDIGKAGVHASVLNKPGPLTPEEEAEMAKHVEYGVKMLTATNQNLSKLGYTQEQIRKTEALAHANLLALREIAEIVALHHCPLSDAPDMPVEARLLAVADTYDALVHGRSYWQACSAPDALRYLEERSPATFDPDAIRLLRLSLKGES